MSEILLQKTRHCTYESGHHLVWCPKYRRKVYASEVFSKAFKFHTEDACKRNEMVLIEIEVDLDHAHLFLSWGPSMSASKAVNIIKGYTSRKLREGFPELKKNVHADSLWPPSYYWGTVGTVTAEGIKKYIQANAGKSSPAPSP